MSENGFSEEEIERIIARTVIPDGLVIMDQFAEIYKSMFDCLDRFDVTSEFGWSGVLGEALNQCYSTDEGATSTVDHSRAIDTVTVLVTFTIRLISMLSDDDRMEFLFQVENEYEEDLAGPDCLNPWYDIMDDVAAICDFFDGLDELAFNSHEPEQRDDSGDNDV